MLLAVLVLACEDVHLRPLTESIGFPFLAPRGVSLQLAVWLLPLDDGLMMEDASIV